MGAAPELIHATAIALAGRAALIRGASGTGKSDLALRCLGLAPSTLIANCFDLVSDDQVLAVAAAGRVIVSAPPSIHGLIEVRGIGIIAVPAVKEATLALVVELVSSGRPDRLPEILPPALIAGVVVPRIEIDPLEPAAPLKVALALAKRDP